MAALACGRLLRVDEEPTATTTRSMEANDTPARFGAERARPTVAVTARAS
jgi:hypothetical protein